MAWTLLRAEGVAALRDRLLDRREVRRRRRSFVRVDESQRPDPPAPVLNVLPTAPRPDWGGVQAQLLRRLEVEAEERTVALLYPDGGAWRLEVRAVVRRTVRVYEEAFAPRPERLEDAGFVAVVGDAARWVGAAAVHFEQLVGLPLRSVAELSPGLRRVISIHDFGLFCPRPHLLERPLMRFCGFCRDAERCARCLRHDWPVADDFQAERRAVAARLLRSAEVVYPSDTLRRTYAELVPGLDAARQHVVAPPAVSEPVMAPALRRGPIRHLAYVGSVQPHKGAQVFEELVGRLAGQGLRWTVYGGGDPVALRRLRRAGVRVRGYYRAGELPRILRRDNVDLVLLLSIWPETYGLTLDECLLAGVPVAAFDHGALAERLRAHGAGVLTDPQAGVDGVASVLHPLLAGGWRDKGRPFVPSSARVAARACLELYGVPGTRASGP